MTEENQDTATTDEATQEGATEDQQQFDADYVAGLRREAAKYRTEAKAAAAELEKQRRASMTETERATAEAEERGRNAAQADFAKRLVKSDIRAEAASAGADLAGVFDYLDLSRFVGEDGEPDAKAIAAFVGSLPKAAAPPPSFDGGTRKTSAGNGDMNSLIRKAAGLG